MSVLFLIYFAAWFICSFAQDNRPNIILIMTDDQDIVLNSMQAMPNAIQLIANQGITFKNSFISTPICCPSRTETISGRYLQNVLEGDQSRCMHVSSTFNIFNNTKSLFQRFQSNGYLTGTFGKLVNNQKSFWCPNDETDLRTNGFTRINGGCTVGYYNKDSFEMYMNGTQIMEKLKNPVPENYFTSVIGNKSLTWMQEVFELKTRKPLIAWIGPHAPHYEATPAAWYADKFSNASAPRTPNWNLKNVEHHSFVSTNPSINDSESGDAVMFIDQLYRDRLRSLLSVDDIIYELFQLLKKYDELDNTVIVYTSDHGYDLGQLRIPCSKQEPYETALRIPMYMYAPNNIIQKKGIINDKVVGNVDLLPTFLDIAGIEYDSNDYDGKSWVGSLIGNNTNKWDRNIFLSQYWSVGTYYFNHCNTWFPSSDGSVCPGSPQKPPAANLKNQTWFVDDTQTNNWRALRIINDSMDAMYVEFVDAEWNETAFEKPNFIEFYNITNDKWEINNIYNTLSKDMQNTLHEMVMQLGQCHGSDCW